ncbi:MAG: hypothetical protein HYS27_05670 [Deltaproteobacteria bacterium]|nr:hypothetical protein [Deltaproteobacteria bacterium]
MRRNRIAITLAGTAMAAALTTGCLQERSYTNTPEVEPALQVRGDYAAVRGAIDGHIRGDIGPVTGLNHDASEMMAFDDGEYASVETVVELQDRATMTLLSIVGPGTVLRAGFHGSFSLESYASDAVNVTMLGCVGQEVDVYDEYDMPADEVNVDVEQGEQPDELEISATGIWHDHDASTGERLATFREASTRVTLLR